MRLPTEAETLQASAIIVAAPRYCGAFAAAIGIDVLSYWPGFAHVEIGSGLAMAILEGWAIAFMFRRWGAMSFRVIRWWVLLLLQFALMLMLPMTVTPYLMSAQYKVPVAELAGMSMSFVWAWSFVVAAASPVILAAVGYADTDKTPDIEPDITTTKPDISVTSVTPEADKPVTSVTPKAKPRKRKKPAGKMSQAERWEIIKANSDKTRVELAALAGVTPRTIGRDIEAMPINGNGRY